MRPANYAFCHPSRSWYLWNSAKVAALTTALTLLVGVPAAFVLSRESFPRRQALVTALLAVQMVSPMVMLVPIYGLVARLGLLDSHAGLVLVYASLQLPFTICVLRLLRRAPRLRAGRPADGASRLHAAVIVLPLAAPGLAAVAIFTSRGLGGVLAGAGAPRLAATVHDPVGLFSFRRHRRPFGTWWPRPASSASFP
jgi:multiple sugar transport system permease protein